jgi:hypothetical protein
VKTSTKDAAKGRGRIGCLWLLFRLDPLDWRHAAALKELVKVFDAIG